MSDLAHETLISAICAGLSCEPDQAQALLRKYETRQGGPSARLEGLLEGLSERFPEAHQRWSSAPAEPSYLAAIDRLLKKPVG